MLTPAHVDQVSGYRRYRESQLATARLVAMLRRLDMPLSQVAEVVSAVGTQAAEVAMLRRPEMSAASGIRNGFERWWVPEGPNWWRRTGKQSSAESPHNASWRRTFKTDSRDEKGVSICYEIRERDVPEQIVLTEQRQRPG